MTSIAKIVPSGSTNGKPIKVVATASTGTTFHTTGSGTSVLDEVHMYLSNTSTSDVIATVEFGGTTSPDNLLKFTVPASETICAIPGLILCNSLVVTVFAATGNVLTMSGFINRIT
jgi:hypothetical protein